MHKRLITILIAGASAIGTLAAAPTIATNGIKNSASYAYPGFPNGAIAQGSLFVVFGSAMGPSPIQYVSAFPLPANLVGTSVNVTVGGTTVACPMIYTSDGQIAAIMPSNTPVGTGTMTVSYNGSASATSPVKVVPSSPGIFTVNQQGSGPGVIQDANGNQNGLTASFNPNQTVVVWGTGLGAITAADNAVPPTGNIPNVKVTANVAGKNAVVQYSGRSGSAGVDQINVTLPDGVTGCYVPLYITAAAGTNAPVTSNFVTVSIAESGKTCNDPQFPNVTSANGYRFGTVALSRSSATVSAAGLTITNNTDAGSGIFEQFDPTALAGASGFSFYDITVGSCSVYQFNGGATAAGPQPKILDAGSVINVTGPNGVKTLTKTNGIYSATFSTSTTGLPIGGGGGQPPYLDPGSYTIDNGSGGADVGPFKLSMVLPPTFMWTNKDAITSIDRTQNLQITWTGGDPNSQVQVVGNSAIDATGQSPYISFICYAKDSDLQLTVPSAILSLLPPSGTTGGTPLGSLFVYDGITVTGSASGLDQLSGGFQVFYPKSGIAYK